MLIRFSKLPIILFSCILTVAGCKDPSLVGIDALPNSDGYPINVVDTFSIVGFSQLEDSLQTSNLNSGNWLLGSFNDPVFGISASTLYTQFRLPSSNVDFGDGATIDSVVLYLSYSGAYGSWDRFKGFQKLDLYRLDEDLDDATNYFSNQTRTLGAYETSAYFRPDLFNEVVIQGGTGEDPDTVLPALRIKLSDQLGTDILNSVNLDSNEAFVSEFKGLAIQPDHSILSPENGSIMYVNLYGNTSRIRLYYHTEPDSIQTFDLEFGRDAATHTHFFHDYTGTTVINDTGSLDVGKERLYVQSMAGMSFELDFTTLRNLSEGRNVAINKAELIVPIDPSSHIDFAAPQELFITSIDTSGEEHVLVDYLFGQGDIGGQFDALNNKYVFSVTGHIQRILNDPFFTTKIKVSNSANAVNGYRGILNGTEHPSSPIKLRITFTEIQP